jgi:Kef-type K+ transport system membrane component KefB
LIINEYRSDFKRTHLWLAIVGAHYYFWAFDCGAFPVPGLLGLLIGGALVGPNMLGILDDYTTYENIGQLGILYLIFLSSLQMDLETFRRFWRISGVFGLITSVIPFALGTL